MENNIGRKKFQRKKLFCTWNVLFAVFNSVEKIHIKWEKSVFTYIWKNQMSFLKLFYYANKSV